MVQHKKEKQLLLHYIWKFIALSGLGTICYSLSNTTEGACPTLKLDLVIILDTSTSVTEPNFRKSQDFVRNILTPLPIESDSVRVALVRYSTDVEIVSYLNDRMKKEDKLKEVSAIKYRLGNTYTDDALLKVRTEVLVPHKGDRTDVQDLIVLITDGKSQRSGKTVKEAKLLKQKSNIQILAIGVTQQIDELELRNVSSGRNMFLKIQSFSDLDHELDVIKPIVCSGGIENNESLSSMDIFMSTPSSSHKMNTFGINKFTTTGSALTVKKKANQLNLTRHSLATAVMDRRVTKDYSWSRSVIADSLILDDVSRSSNLFLKSSVMFSLTSNFSASDKSSSSLSVNMESSTPPSYVTIGLSSFSTAVTITLSSSADQTLVQSSILSSVIPLSSPESFFPVTTSLSVSTTEPPDISHSSSTSQISSATLHLSPSLPSLDTTSSTTPLSPLSITSSLSTSSSLDVSFSTPSSALDTFYSLKLPSFTVPLLSSSSSPITSSTLATVHSPSLSPFSSDSSHSFFHSSPVSPPPSVIKLQSTSLLSSYFERLTQFPYKNQIAVDAPLPFLASSIPTSSHSLTAIPYTSTILHSQSIHSSPTLQNDSSEYSVQTKTLDHSVSNVTSMASSSTVNVTSMTSSSTVNVTSMTSSSTVNVISMTSSSTVNVTSMRSSSTIWISTNSTHLDSSASISPDADNNKTLYIYLGATAAGFFAVLISGILLAVVVRKSQSRSQEEN